MSAFDLALLAISMPLIAILCFGTYRSIVDPEGNAEALSPRKIKARA